MAALVLTVGAACAAVAHAFYIYRRRELPVRGRGVLIALRAAVLVGAVVLLADPALPGSGSTGAPERWLIVDHSQSMTVAGPSGATPAERAAAHRPAGGNWRRTTFGGAPGGAPEGGGGESRLAPLLRGAAESGAREVEVVTDLRIADRLEVEGLRETLGLAVTFVDVGEELFSAGIGAVAAPATGRAGETVQVEVEVFGSAAAAGAEARLRLEREGTLVGDTTVLLPPPGRSVWVTLSAPLPDASGPAFWRVRLELDGDVFAADDERAAVTDVDPLEGLLAVISLRPDWEPRFLLPTLERVTGLPARGWLRVGDDAYQPMDGAGGLLDSGAMARVAADARLLVLHGVAGEPPEWVVRAQDRGQRVVVFAHDAQAARAVGVTTDPPRGGEWYPVDASGPVAAALTGVEWAALPPLLFPLPLAGGGGATALVVEGSGGARVGVLQLDEQGGRRRALVLARGFWRWAFRHDAGLAGYDRLWSGVAGWLLAGGEQSPGGGVGPRSPVAAADRPVAWRAPALAGGQLEITTTDAGGATRTDTVAVAADGWGQLAPLAPGAHRWSGRALAPDSLAEQGESWQGRLEVEAYTDELRWPRDTTLLGWEGGARTAAPDPGGRPLRTASWPWLLLIALLGTEWILRRRSGLR